MDPRSIKAGFMFVVETDAGHFEVRRKERPESEMEHVVVEAFNDRKDAEQLRDRLNDEILNPPDPMQFAELETETLTDIPIFAAGTHTDMNGHKREYTVDEVQRMAENGNTQAAGIKPFFKLLAKNHNPTFATPAIGWLKNFRERAGELVVDIVNVPKKVAQLIRAKAYATISSEIMLDYKKDGHAFGDIVSCAGLIGAQHPAVKNMRSLEDVLNLYGVSDEKDVLAWQGAFTSALPPANAVLFVSADETEGGEAMPPETKPEVDVQAVVDAAVDAALAPMRSALGVETNAEIGDAVASLKTGKEQAEVQLTANVNEQNKAKFDAVIQKAKEEGKLLPVDEPMIRRMFGDDPNATSQYADAGGKVRDMSAIDGMTAWFARANQVITLGETGAEGNDDVELDKTVPTDVQQYAQDNGYEIVNVEQNARVLDRQREDKTLSYEQALTDELGVSGAVVTEPVLRDGA